MRIFRRHTVLVMVGLSMCLVAANARGQDSDAMKAAYQLFDAMDSARVYQETVVKLVDLQIEQRPQIAPLRQVMLTFFQKYMGWDSIKGDLASIYAQNFTVQELKELTQFYKTPLWNKAAKLIPEIGAQAVAPGQKRVQDNIGELQRMINEEIEKTMPKPPPEPKQQ